MLIPLQEPLSFQKENQLKCLAADCFLNRVEWYEGGGRYYLEMWAILKTDNKVILKLSSTQNYHAFYCNVRKYHS